MGECRNTAIVLAAGQGKRMHSKIQKQFMELDGMPVLCYSLRCFQESPLIRDVILVTGEEYVFWCKEEIVEKYGFTKVSAVVSGGKERYDSVYEGLRACKDTEYVLIHDGARPFIDHGIIERGLMAAAQTGASVTGMPFKDYLDQDEPLFDMKRKEGERWTPNNRFMYEDIVRFFGGRQKEKTFNMEKKTFKQKINKKRGGNKNGIKRK